MSVNWSDAAYFLPEAIMALTFMGCVIADMVMRGRRHDLTMLKRRNKYHSQTSC